MSIRNETSSCAYNDAYPISLVSCPFCCHNTHLSHHDIPSKSSDNHFRFLWNWQIKSLVPSSSFLQTILELPRCRVLIQWIWRVQSSGMWHHAVWYTSSNVSGVHTAFIFRMEGTSLHHYQSTETCGDTFQKTKITIFTAVRTQNLLAWRWGQQVSLKHWCLSTKLYGITYRQYTIHVRAVIWHKTWVD